MGKHKKLRSSVKILHKAVASFTPAVAGHFCIQPDKTHSSRDLITGFNSLQCHTPPSSAASYPLCSHGSLFLQIQNREYVEEVAVSVSGAAKISTSTCSSCLSSSSSSSLPAATGGSDDPADAELFPSGMINSERFFFSPCSSKSIATLERCEVVGFSDMEQLSCHNSPGGTEKAGEDGNVKVLDTFAKTQAKTTMEEWTRAEPPEIFLGSAPMAMASRDPYGDFRSSMEEMVMANGLWDWASLKELLHCYLRLNEKKTHGFIVLAFLDLLMQLPLHPCP